MITVTNIFQRWRFGICLLALLLSAPEHTHAQESKAILLYFIRHTEAEGLLVPAGEGIYVDVCNPTRTCCQVVLNSLGVARRKAITDWFVEQRLAISITDIIATHKPWTAQTVQLLADASGVAIHQYPSDTGECDPGFEDVSSSRPYVVAAIRALPPGSRALIVNHGQTLYPIIAETTGLDTTDSELFPRTSDGRVLGNDQIWIVQIAPDGHSKLVQHIEFDLKHVPSAPRFIQP